MITPHRPCRICGKPSFSYKRKDRNEWIPRKQCLECKNKPRDEAAWRENMSKSKMGSRNHAFVEAGTRCKTLCGKRVYWKIKTKDGKWVYEHRLVMEKKLGRKLGKSEQVHHINNDPSDNRPENLEALSHKEHKARHYPDCHVNLVCSHCGKKFVRYKSNIISKNIYCSRSCYFK